MTDELVRKKLELLVAQKAKANRIHELLNGPDGFNEASRKTCKNLEAAVTASKRPGYFAYYEQPDHLTAAVRSGEIERVQEQLTQLQKQIDQLSDKIEEERQRSRAGESSVASRANSSSSSSPHVHSLAQWFATYGTPLDAAAASGKQYSSFTPDKKVYGGTTHYAAFRSQASTMAKGRLTR